MHEYKRGPISIKEKRKVYQIYCTKCRTPRPRKPRPSYLNIKKENDDGAPGTIDDKAATSDLTEDQEMKDTDGDYKDSKTTTEKDSKAVKDAGDNSRDSGDQIKKEQNDVKPELKDVAKSEVYSQLVLPATPSASVAPALPSTPLSGVSSRGRPVRRARGRGRRTLATPRSQENTSTPMEE